MVLSLTESPDYSCLGHPWQAAVVWDPANLLLISLCIGQIKRTVALLNMFSTSRKHFVFQAILSGRSITSTKVHGADSQTTLPGNHTLSMTGYEPRLCERGTAATARLPMSPSSVESTPVPQLLDFLISARIWISFDIFPQGAIDGICILVEATPSQPAWLLGPE